MEIFLITFLVGLFLSYIFLYFYREKSYIIQTVASSAQRLRNSIQPSETKRELKELVKNTHTNGTAALEAETKENTLETESPSFSDITSQPHEGQQVEEKIVEQHSSLQPKDLTPEEKELLQKQNKAARKIQHFLKQRMFVKRIHRTSICFLTYMHATNMMPLQYSKTHNERRL
jgi:hypothetical protein